MIWSVGSRPRITKSLFHMWPQDVDITAGINICIVLKVIIVHLSQPDDLDWPYFHNNNDLQTITKTSNIANFWKNTIL